MSKSPVYRRRRWAALGVAFCLLATLALGSRLFAMPGDEAAGAGKTARQDARQGDARPSKNPPTEKVGLLSGDSTDDGKRPVNVLILGVDKRPEGDPEASLVEGSRSDTMILARIDPESGDVKLLSVPRDLYLEIHPGDREKVNAAYSTGGVPRATSVVEDYTGMSVDHYAVVDFQGFEEVVDALGGVRIDVRTPLPPEFGIGLGTQTLKGEQALDYARYRGTPTADLGRIERQQAMISALRKQALRWGSITRVPKLVSVVEKNVQTDVGFGESLSLAGTLLRHGEDSHMSATQLKGEPEYLPDGTQVLEPDDEANRKTIEEFKR